MSYPINFFVLDPETGVIASMQEYYALSDAQALEIQETLYTDVYNLSGDPVSPVLGIAKGLLYPQAVQAILDTCDVMDANPYFPIDPVAARWYPPA